MASGGSSPESSRSSVSSSSDSEFSETDSSSETAFENEGTTLLHIPELNNHKKFLSEVSSFLIHQSKSMFTSLLNDYTQSDFFAIDGDSLLLTCAKNETLKTGQELHFFFLVESFLLNLIKKGGKFAVVFFQDMECMYMGRSDLICLRTQLKLHLEENTDTVVYNFSRISSTEWKTFLQADHPYFLMVSDEGVNALQTYLFNLMILNALGNSTNVVLTAGQENDHLRVYGYYTLANRHHFAFLKDKEDKLGSAVQALVEGAQTSGKPDCLTLFQQFESHSLEKQVLESITHLSMSFSQGSDIRTIISTVSCSLILKILSENEKSTPSPDSRCSLTLHEVADLCKMYCLTAAILMNTPLGQRAKIRHIKAEWNHDSLRFLDLQKKCKDIILKMTKRAAQSSDWNIEWTNVCDLNDDLLMKNIAYYYEKEDLKFELGKDIEQTYTFLWTTTLQLGPHDKPLESFPIRTTLKPFLSQESSLNVKKEKITAIDIMHVKSALIEDFAGDIMKDLPVSSSDGLTAFELNQPKQYDELSHWDSGKCLSDNYDTMLKKTREKDKWSMRGYQKLQSHWLFYGKSLGLTKPKNIIVEKYKTENTTDVPKYNGKKKEGPMKKKDKIIQDNLKKTKAEEERKESEKWKIMAPSLEKDMRTDLYTGIKRQEKFVSSFESPLVKFKSEMATLKICVDVWNEHCKLKTKADRDVNISVEMMKKIQNVLKNHKEMLAKEDQQKICKYLIDLGFSNLACTLQPTKATGLGGEKVTSNQDDKRENKFAVGVGSARFQMEYMGPYFLRDERTDPDPRVSHFIPDTWQRKLLDVVDNNESAVIVAPTSSGKTYASFYCMEKVLKKSDESVVVYVAPKKALINQVVATVFNMFAKDLPDGKSLCGVITKDYCIDGLNSQVVVTLPECLEVLLMSPKHQDWAKKIEYIIFDEVHCLGEGHDSIWEHLLAMTRCPFLALSATISNAEHLTAWLQSVKRYWLECDEIAEGLEAPKTSHRGGKSKNVKQQRSYRVHLVVHNKRFNDLEKYMCLVKQGEITLEHSHPFGALTIDHIKNYGIPHDMDFSPRESIKLYDTMKIEWTEWPRVQELDPEEYVRFKNKIDITKTDANLYQEDLMKEFVNWIKNGHERKAINVLEHLQIETCHQVNYIKYFPILVEKLKEENKLPALFFGFHANKVEQLAEHLDLHLTKKLEKRRSPNDEKEIKKLEAKAQKLEKTLRNATPDTPEKDQDNVKSTRKGELMQRNSSQYEQIIKKLENLTKTPEDCTYADENAIDKETLTTIFDKLKKLKNEKEIKRMANKGIGYHHESGKPSQRLAVETLLRMGYMRVVTATQTLALGINMPCKSVVFFQDSVYLDALNYRQMSGRAGRRGQDLLGSVFFFNIPDTKVKKLLKSGVPHLNGQFSLSISLILRLMLLVARAEDKEDSNAKGYLDQDCNLLAFTDLATMLHNNEPSNFVLVSFLHKGLFRMLCQPFLEGTVIII
uniref:ATP-dependent RNA helicase DDX60 n=1 Tax=Leptobrachium leishanense TaxID=445787 RepID=A0A8C5R9G8_9ANUR